MRGVGIVLLAIACLMASIQALRQRRDRIRALREIADALTLLQGELSLRSESLPRLFSQLRERCEGTGRELFGAVADESERLGEKTFAQIWRSSAGICAASLRQTERESLLRLGEILGRMELELQLEALRETIGQLRQEQRRAEETFPEERRLCLGLGAAMAATLGIVLL